MNVSLRHSADSESIVFTNVDALLNLSKEHSLWYLLFATACCGIELMQTGASRFDVDRFGMIPRSTPRQSDLLIVAGTITHKMASRVKRLYEQMAEPKWVISMGSCSNSGGPFCKYSYSVLRGIDKYIPVDVYVPGCPPRPEALIEGVFKLRERIRTEHVLRKTSQIVSPRPLIGNCQ
ncbi:MAG: NADH-quinone oxidoreductase subunit B family protein [Planctomycetota bacterium]